MNKDCLVDGPHSVKSKSTALK